MMALRLLAASPDFRLDLLERVTVEVDPEVLDEDEAREEAVEAWLMNRVVSAWAGQREAAVEMFLRLQQIKRPEDDPS